MDSFDNLVLYNILLQSEPKDIRSLCRTSKKFSKLCSNDVIFKNLLEAHFPKTVKRKNTYKEQYFHMIDILTEDNFDSIKTKQSKAKSKLGFPINKILDIYDLLYLTGGERDWGVVELIKIPFLHQLDPHFIIPFPFKEFFLLRFFLLDELFTDYKREEIGRTRSFLNDVQEGRFKIDDLTWEDIVNQEEEIGTFYKNKENYMESLSTLEERLQKEIKNFPSDVRGQIKKYQYDNKNMKETSYDDKEIEFLQIFHDAVQNDLIGIFEPFDFQILMNKLRGF